jgi:hypothetical protein
MEFLERFQSILHFLLPKFFADSIIKKKVKAGKQKITGDLACPGANKQKPDEKRESMARRG